MPAAVVGAVAGAVSAVAAPAPPPLGGAGAVRRRVAGVAEAVAVVVLLAGVRRSLVAVVGVVDHAVAVAVEPRRRRRCRPRRRPPGRGWRPARSCPWRRGRRRRRCRRRRPRAGSRRSAAPVAPVAELPSSRKKTARCGCAADLGRSESAPTGSRPDRRVDAELGRDRAVGRAGRSGVGATITRKTLACAAEPVVAGGGPADVRRRRRPLRARSGRSGVPGGRPSPR